MAKTPTLAQLQTLAERHNLWIHDYEEAGLDVIELHSNTEKKGPGSERFIRITGFPITLMVSMLCAALSALPDKGGPRG